MKKENGKVMNLRVSTENIMGVHDVLTLAGVSPGDYTLPAAVSRVLSMLLASMREAGSIPSRDGFEYERMLSDFRHTATVKIKQAHTPTVSVGSSAADGTDADMEKWRDLMEQKQTQPGHWSAELEEELKALAKKIGW